MRAIGMWAGSLIAAGILAATAPAQQIRIVVKKDTSTQQQVQVVPRQPFGRFGSRFTLLQNKAVWDELKLSDEQLAKLREMLTRQRDFFKNPPKDFKERLKKQQELLLTQEKAAEALLKPEQTRRLGQIALQQLGDRIFFTPEASAALKLTDEQKKVIREIQQDGALATRGLFVQGSDFRDYQKTLAEHNRAVLQVLLAVLTPAQKKALKELVGPPISGALQPGGGGIFVPGEAFLVPVEGKPVLFQRVVPLPAAPSPGPVLIRPKR